MENIEIVNLILDFILIGIAIWMIVYIVGFQGIVGKAFTIIALGAIILSIAHLQESTFEVIWGIDQDVNDLVHRLIVLSGFIFLLSGFRTLTKKQ